MDRALTLAHLELAERHVARGYEHIASQIRIIASLADGGHDTAVAEKLLATFETVQQMHLADRDRLKKELADYPH